MIMTNSEVINEFLHKRNASTNLRDIINGYYTYKGRTLETKDEAIGFSLYNYNTRIAFIVNNKLYINTHKYSRTTSKIQTQLQCQASKYFNNITRYDCVPEEY